MGRSTECDKKKWEKIKKTEQSTAHDPIDSEYTDNNEYIFFQGINFESLKKDKNGKNIYCTDTVTKNGGKGTKYNLNRWNNGFWKSGEEKQQFIENIQDDKEYHIFCHSAGAIDCIQFLKKLEDRQLAQIKSVKFLKPLFARKSEFVSFPLKPFFLCGKNGESDRKDAKAQLSRLNLYGIPTEVVLGEKDWVLNNKRCEELIEEANKDKKYQIEITTQPCGHNGTEPPKQNCK